MNAKQLADKLNGREYGSEITQEEEAAAKKAGLVVVYGYSDDNIIMAGAFDDEIGAWDGTVLYLHSRGFIEDPDDDDCPKCRKRARAALEKCVKVDCEWDEKGYSWYITPTCAFAPFDIIEDSEPFCRGVVISVKDLPVVAGVED